MATTSIWRVKGWLSKALIYAKNPSKTENPTFFESPDVGEDGLQRLDDVIIYAANEEKTEQHHFVSGVNINPDAARDQMMAVKQKFEKTGGTIAYHGYQSFAPGEATPEIAHEIGVKLAKKLWGDDFQVLIATHTDRGHLHNHFIINTVSFRDGHKFYRSKSDYQKMRDTSDALCREYRLSVIDSPKEGKSKHYAEWKAEKENKPTWRSLIKKDVDEAIENATSTRQFFQNLKNLGYEIKVGSDISVKPPGKERFFRLARNFGESYSQEAITRRVLAHMTPRLTIPKTSAYTPERSMLSSIPKGTIVGLYRHYCYLFGIYEERDFGKHRMPFVLREELRYFDEITSDARLLDHKGIETLEELTTFQTELEKEITSLVTERKGLQAKDRAACIDGSVPAPDPRIAQINEKLKETRKEVKQLKRIAERSIALKKKLPLIEQEQEDKTRKEVSRHGRNRTGNRSTRTDNAHGL